MTLSLPSLLARIADRLSADVLPELPNASWPASHVRSALVLLAHAQTMLEKGPEFLSSEITAMRSFLASAGQDLETKGAAPALAKDIAKALAEPTETMALDGLQALFEHHQHLLNAVIDLAHDGTLPPALADRIRGYLTGYTEREKATFGDVMAMMPL
jgi:hypothetical protein